MNKGDKEHAPGPMIPVPQLQAEGYSTAQIIPLSTGERAKASSPEEGFSLEKADEELMIDFKFGNANSFNIIMERHKAPVFNFIVRFMGGGHYAEEIFQDSFLKIIKAAKTYKPTAKFTTWMYKIVRNQCIDAKRSLRFRTQALTSDPIDPAGKVSQRTIEDTLKSGESDPETKAIGKEMSIRLEHALSGLAEEQREVVLMRERLGMQFEEIAKVIGCPVNTVKSRMRYALENLRRLLTSGDIKGEGIR